MNLDSPLYKALLKHKNLNMSSFHTPGHKSLNGVFPSDLLELDYTELPDTDSLFEASGAIHLAELEARKLFNTKETLFSAGGCTLCIQAMIYTCCKPKDKIISGRIIHRSAINTMALLDLDPIWVYPSYDAGPGLAGRINSKDIECAIIENPDAKAVYITSPDYYGVMSDIKAISKVCKKYDIPLLVDNAHGTHLQFLENNMHPIHNGATMTACSAHKTLPVLTGGAFLNIADSRYIGCAKHAMSIFGSTSPSYAIMASLDLCVSWLKNHGKEEFSLLESKVREVLDISLEKGLTLPCGQLDPTRIILNTKSIGTNGIDASYYFRKMKIEPEYADSNHVVLIPSPMNTDTDFNRLKNAITNMPVSKPLEVDRFIFPKLDKIISPRHAMFLEQETVKVEDSIGRIAAEAACTCPPGMPVVMPGEKIDEKSVFFLLNYGVFNIKVIK